MRIPLLLAVACLGGSLAAQQMSLPAFQNTFTASLTRGFWFQAPVDFVIVGLRVPNEAAQPNQVVEVIDLGGAAPPAFPGTVTGTQLFYDNATAAGSIIPCNIPILNGSFIGVLGACNDFQGSQTSYNSYAANGPFLSDVLGIPTTITRFGTQSGIAANGGNQPCWQESAFNVSRIEVFVAPLGSGTIASNTTLGTGCGGSTLGDGSVYELFASGFDLANTSHTYAWIGNGYILLPGASSGFVTPAGTGVVTLGDDTVTTVNLPFSLPCPQGLRSSITLCSNGFLWFRNNTSADLSESVAELLSQDSRLCFLWDDLNPAAGGQVTAEPDPANPAAFHITFSNVPQFANTDQNTVQVTLFSTGDIEVKYGAVALQDCLVGLSSGNGATDPGQSDYSTLPTAPIGPFTTGQNIPILSLAANTRPVLGTNWDLATSNILPGAVFGMNIFGVSDPNIPDLAFLGMPGCELRATPDVLVGPTLLTPGQSSYTFTFPIPATPTSLVGIEVFSQTAIFGNGLNSFDAITSNGVKGTLGDL